MKIGDCNNIMDFRGLAKRSLPSPAFNYLDGVEALTVRVNKISTANLLEVADSVRSELAAIEAMPSVEGLKINIYSDASNDVRKGLAQLRNAGLLGGTLAILAVYLFIRRMRATALVGMAATLGVVGRQYRVETRARERLQADLKALRTQAQRVGASRRRAALDLARAHLGRADALHGQRRYLLARLYAAAALAANPTRGATPARDATARGLRERALERLASI